MRIGTGASAQFIEHRGARIYSIDLNMGIRVKQTRGKAAVSIAEYERASAISNTAEEFASTPMQPWAKARQFHPAINVSEPAEVRRRC
jgi:hypothetical protein